ncbi:MAG: ParA family protein [Betaproteobacteria bacterium]|nr:ParA family protein [Betaproteobacteria bacterium]
MPTVVFASSKGGVGKTTSAMSFAFVLANQGISTTIIDADPNGPILKWAARFPAGVPEKLTVKNGVGAEAVAEAIQEATDPFIIVDLEGAKNIEVSVGLGRADLALIPMKGSQLDADEAVNVIKFIRRQELIFGRKIPYRVFFSMTSPVIESKGMRDIVSQFREQGIPMLKASMVERAAFQLPFKLGGSLYDLRAGEVRKPEAAIENAEVFAEEVVATVVAEHKNAAKVKEAANG